MGAAAVIGDIGADTIPSFEAATGIHVVYDTFDSEEMLEGKLLAGDSGYDVVDASRDIIPSGIQAGAFTPIDRSRLPNWHHLDPHASWQFLRTTQPRIGADALDTMRSTTRSL